MVETTAVLGQAGAPPIPDTTPERLEFEIVPRKGLIAGRDRVRRG